MHSHIYSLIVLIYTIGCTYRTIKLVHGMNSLSEDILWQLFTPFLSE